MNTDPGINNEESDGGEDVLALRIEVDSLRGELRAALDAIEMARDAAPHAEDEDFGNFPMILPESGAMDYSQVAFGFLISGATVTVKAGDLPLGETEASMNDTDIVISVDHQYVGLEVDPIAATIQVIGPSTSKSVFLPGDGKFRTWLHQFRFTPSTTEGESGKASFERTHLGSIFMPGHYSK